MMTRTLLKRYPWYGRHFRAVNTLAACMLIDVVDVLQRLDRHVRRSDPMLHRSAAARKAA